MELVHKNVLQQGLQGVPRLSFPDYSLRTTTGIVWHRIRAPVREEIADKVRAKIINEVDARS